MRKKWNNRSPSIVLKELKGNVVFYERLIKRGPDNEFLRLERGKAVSALNAFENQTEVQS